MSCRRITSLLLVTMVFASNVVASAAAERWIHPKCKLLETKHLGPFINLPDGSILTADEDAAWISRDDGKTWSLQGKILEGRGQTFGKGTRNRLLLRTNKGTIVLVYMDLSSQKFKWDEKNQRPEGEVTLNVWSARSEDDGKTWTDFTMVLKGYCGSMFDILQTRDGRIVVPLHFILPYDPDHSGISSYASDDDGRMWKQSNVIDLGGRGHHDGALEPTAIELKDGRLWMLIRTNWDKFWEAFSEDQGHTWRTIRPTSIDASSAPAHLIRLASGRLVMAWNRLYPEGQTSYRRMSLPFSEESGCWNREELSIAFSDDDGKTWSKPVVIVRQKGAWLSYPHLFEVRPGELWLTLRFSGLKLKLCEEDFVGE